MLLPGITEDVKCTSGITGNPTADESIWIAAILTHDQFLSLAKYGYVYWSTVKTFGYITKAT